MKKLWAAGLTCGTLIVAALAGAPAAHAAETCRGVAATIVGNGSANLTGTEGRDVIITGGALEVHALAGDDLICVTAPAMVDAGAGNDVVDSTGNYGDESTYLGDGDDTFIGGPGIDEVHGADAVPGNPAVLDVGTDVIETGAGPDFVSSGAASAPNSDHVDTGDGPDVVTVHGLPGQGFALDLGTDRNIVQVFLDPGTETHLVLGNAPLQTQEGETALAWAGTASTVYVHGVASRGSLRFQGTGGDDLLAVDGLSGMVVDVSLGNGDDEVDVPCGGELLEGSRLLAGRGHDKAFVGHGSYCRSTRIDLRKPQLIPGVRAEGLEDLEIWGRGVRVHGDAAPNTIRVHGCHSAISGGDGADFLKTWRLDRCHGTTATLDGNGGSDTLVGGTSDDTLVGGQGHDTARGGPGTDTCLAEVTHGCER